MSVDPEFTLKHTNVSRPQLSHQGSQQSVAASLAASEGLISALDLGSSDSDGKTLYHTPSSYHRTPAASHENLPQPEPPVTSLRGFGIPRQQLQIPPSVSTHDRAHTSPIYPIAEERPTTRGTRRSQPQRDMDSESLATTPGQDATPYIRFAIDQLTRDEEVRGSRVYPEVRRPVDEEDYPVERIVSDDGLGYMAQEQRTQDRMSKYASPKANRKSSSRKAESVMPLPMMREPEKRPFLHTRSHSGHAGSDVFVAHSQHLPLQFVPAILRPLWLCLFIFVSLIMLAALLFSAVYSNREGGSGLWDYLQFGDNRYFIFEYLPTLVGMLIFVWVIQIQTALQRIVPFISMASNSFHKRSDAVFLQLYPRQFLLPKLEYFRAGQRRVGGCFVVFWLFTWTIPLLASSYNVRYDLDRGVWRWVAVQGVIWTVIVLYILLIIALVVLMLFLMRNDTGLRWDPRSLADIISLLERSNITADYNGSETFQEGDWEHVKDRADRLGYWTTTKRPNDTFYGIGEEGGEVRKFSVEDGRIRERGNERPNAQGERNSDFSIRMDIRNPTVRLRYLPWYLRDSSVIAWIVIACVLLIAFLVVSFVNSAVHLGFLPQVFARTNDMGFSASNFLYSFIPALIATFLYLALLSLDYSLRTLQPYIALSSPGGATAERSLLVDYASRLPLSVTISAIENGHFQTALLSLSSLLSLALPVLAGGCFWTQYYSTEESVRVSADLPGYYALCVFLALYTFSLFALLPGRRRAALPHASNSLAETVSWIYQSRILTDRAFARPQTKAELVARLMGTRYLESTWTRSVASLVRPSKHNLRDEAHVPALKEKPGQNRGSHEGGEAGGEPAKIRYGFGIHVGRDGLEHLGIDRVRRGERSGRDLVIWEEQRKTKRKSWTEQV